MLIDSSIDILTSFLYYLLNYADIAILVLAMGVLNGIMIGIFIYPFISLWVWKRISHD